MSSTAKRPSRPRIPALSRLGCTSYAAGHGVHWIQALHTANKPEVSRASWRGQIVSIDGEVITVRRHDGEIVVLRNHDPARLIAISGGPGAGVLVNDQYAILRVGGYTFSVLPDSGEPLEPCPTDELRPDATDDELVARLDSHGGFSVPVNREVRS